MATQKVRIVFKKKTAGEWVLEDPVLMKAEPGYEEDTGRMKIGNGITRWVLLPYFTPDRELSEALASQIVAEAIQNHVVDETPHPAYDDGPSFALLYLNSKV